MGIGLDVRVEYSWIIWMFIEGLCTGCDEAEKGLAPVPSNS